ncbi:hypothetical protein HN51_047531, partial [Arachis hypogaea]
NKREKAMFIPSLILIHEKFKTLIPTFLRSINSSDHSLHIHTNFLKIPAVTNTVLAAPLASPLPRLLLVTRVALVYLVTSVVLLADLLCIVISPSLPPCPNPHHCLPCHRAATSPHYASTAHPPRICYIPRSCRTRPCFIKFVADIFPLLQIYAGSFFAIPLVRWFFIRKRNADIEKRNKIRKQCSKVLELPDPSLRQK